MTTTSSPGTAARSNRPVFVYLQRPDDGHWVTVGRYLPLPETGSARFRYAQSYADAGLNWAIDPVNLPFRVEVDWPAPRYSGLHDVLRDACPDQWGQWLLRREHHLPEDAPPVRYLMLASNSDRWGALAVGNSPKAAVEQLASPRLPQLAAVVEELAALEARRPAVHPALRRRLVQTAGAGGARPKTTVRDEQGRYWLVKPIVSTDVVDIPALERATQRWGAASGLRFAQTTLHPGVAGRCAVSVLRFDRDGDRRLLCVSAASLLQAEYPGGPADRNRWSYPRLAEELQRIGAPVEDRHELFGRMVFNAVCGNDDDHVRNHAVVYQHAEHRWRLAPAFDVVPNATETPTRLALQVCVGRFDIDRAALLADAHRFGFSGRDVAVQFLGGLLGRIDATFAQVAQSLPSELEAMLQQRLRDQLALLTGH